MPTANLKYADPFNTGRRPYLALRLIGVNGAQGDVTGLIDSGADLTQLPLGFASLMGYDGSTLDPIQIGTAGAVTQVFRAKQPSRAYVVGIPDVVFEMLPVFNPSSEYVLWGRSDFMVSFGVSIFERDQEFVLHW